LGGGKGITQSLDELNLLQLNKESSSIPFGLGLTKHGRKGIGTASRVGECRHITGVGIIMEGNKDTETC
jgi:hypothetical protein